MTGHSAHLILVLLAWGAITLSSCNKDEYIEDSAGQTDGEYREPSAGSSLHADRVYDYTPAPGQFINDPASGGMTDDILTMQEACAWAKSRLDNRQFVSLGGFGGYIVVGFDHSILSSDGSYDFAVAGNAFFNSSGGGGSNEPGIVYVMQDSNGNGLPDDTWYELKGSESGSGEVIRDYSVTYYKPDIPASDVEWQDNRGASGVIDYLSAFHKQPFYYPAWIADSSYTLSGTCLKARTEQDPETGLWNNNAYAFGYSDNMGSDVFSAEGFAQCNRFRVSDAIDKDGSAVSLKYIDFVKIQTGVNAKSGSLGEVSTEVCGVFDLNL